MGHAIFEMLSAHIGRAEFEHSQMAEAHAIANVMPDALVPAAQALCIRLLEPIRAHFGVPLLLNSGYRGRALNRALGSKPTSQHRRGEAADIELPDGPNNAELAQWIAGSDLPFDQLILESYRTGAARSGWVHVSHAYARGQRGEVLTMTLASHGPVYSNGLRV